MLVHEDILVSLRTFCSANWFSRIVLHFMVHRSLIIFPYGVNFALMLFSSDVSSSWGPPNLLMECVTDCSEGQRVVAVCWVLSCEAAGRSLRALSLKDGYCGWFCRTTITAITLKRLIKPKREFPTQFLATRIWHLRHIKAFCRTFIVEGQGKRFICNSI